MDISKGNVTRLGSNRDGKGYNFALASESGEVTLHIYDSGLKLKNSLVMDQAYKTGNVFACRISGVSLEKAYYSYEINGTHYVDPYAKTITDCEQFGIEKKDALYVSRVVLDDYDWEGDSPLNIAYEDCVFYKMHVRGYTKSKSSGVRAKGTFAGIIEKIPYMKSLGITTVELMPAYEFDELGRFAQLQEKETSQGIYASIPIKTPVNYWGYVSGFHFAPKAAYTKIAAKKSDYTAEFKDLVKTLHKNGLEVVMEMFFDRETPDMVLDCIRYWVTQYHIDGVHLYGSTVSLEMAAADPVLSHTKIITVYWDGAMGSIKHMANYNDGFLKTVRCFLKGDENQLADYVRLCRDNPAQSANINYITNHNGFTLADMVSYERKHNEANGENNRDGDNFNYTWNCGEEGSSRKKRIVTLRRRQVKNALMMLMFSAGTPLIMAGDEFENSQEGNNNPYCVDSEVSWVNWKNNNSAKELLGFVKQLIAYRKSNKILHMPERLIASDSVSCGYPDVSYHGSNAWYNACENFDRHVGIMYCSNYDKETIAGEDYKLIYIAYNMHWEQHELALPKLPLGCEWNVVMCSDKELTAVNIKDDKTVLITPRSAAVIEAVIKTEKPKRKSVKKVSKNGTK
ncbi:MAG: alpha-amylase [Lachnospira sp.]|nr:alpha-amylase [Lachnospira sp.]